MKLNSISTNNCDTLESNRLLLHTAMRDITSREERKSRKCRTDECRRLLLRNLDSERSLYDAECSILGTNRVQKSSRITITLARSE